MLRKLLKPRDDRTLCALSLPSDPSLLAVRRRADAAAVEGHPARRVGHATPIDNLYLAGAWSRPGHGYGAVIPSGLECFAEIMDAW